MYIYNLPWSVRADLVALLNQDGTWERLAGDRMGYGHLDIAALLIRFSTVVNATDKWGFTPLHEAAQKGRTQLCALLLAHGADPTLKNQEGQNPLELASADDVKCLLQVIMVV